MSYQNYRYSTSHQVVIDADTRLGVAVGRPLPGNRSDCKTWEESGAEAAVGKTMTIADGGYRGTGPSSSTAAAKAKTSPTGSMRTTSPARQVRATMSAARARRAAENAGGRRTPTRCRKYAALGRDELREAARAVVLVTSDRG
jgi:hypothetical protein